MHFIIVIRASDAAKGRDENAVQFLLPPSYLVTNILTLIKRVTQLLMEDEV